MRERRREQQADGQRSTAEDETDFLHGYIWRAAGRSVRYTPNPPLKRPPYEDPRRRGTIPVDTAVPMPGVNPFHAARYRVYPPCSFATLKMPSSPTARSWQLYSPHSNLPYHASRARTVTLVSTSTAFVASPPRSALWPQPSVFAQMRLSSVVR